MKILFLLSFLFLSSTFARGQNEQSQPFRPDWCKNLPRPVYQKLKRVHVKNDWFEVYEIRPGVFAIYEPKQFQEVISYLILGSRHALLFDSGLGIASIKSVVDELTRLPVMVLNSHTHPDHIGGNHEFRNILSVDTAYTRKNAAGNSDMDVSDWVKPEQLCAPLPSGFHAESYKIQKYNVSRYVNDGESIDLGDRKLTIIRTPGHTPDSLCLLDSSNGLLFTGDTYYAGPLYLYVPETNWNDFKSSIEKLEHLTNRLNILLPAHNEPVADPHILGDVLKAIHEVEAGTLKPKISNDFAEYVFNGFSFLLKPQKK